MRHEPPFSRYLPWKRVSLADELHAAATRTAWYVWTTLQVLPSSAEPGIIQVPGCYLWWYSSAGQKTVNGSTSTAQPSTEATFCLAAWGHKVPHAVHEVNSHTSEGGHAAWVPEL